MPDEPGRTILDNIVSTRRRTLEETRLAVPLERVQQMAEARQERRDFAAALAPARPRRLAGVARDRGAQARVAFAGAAAAALSPPRNCFGICRRRALRRFRC